MPGRKSVNSVGGGGAAQLAQQLIDQSEELTAAKMKTTTALTGMEVASNHNEALNNVKAGASAGMKASSKGLKEALA